MKIPSTTKTHKATKKGTARPTKRRRVGNGQSEEELPKEDDPEKTMLESMEWKCVCANIEEYKQLIEKWKKSKNQDEKAMRSYLIEDVLPVLEAVEEVRLSFSLKK